MKYRLIAFDLDGTLLQGENSWMLLHRRFNTEPLAEQSHRLYLEGRISYEEFMRRDFQHWPRPLHRSVLEGVLSLARLRPEAPYVVEKLKERGMKIAIITSALDILAEKVARRLGIEVVRANGIGFDEKGYFDGRLFPRVEPLRKHEVLEEVARTLSIPLDQTVAVGDSFPDSSFLKAAGLGLVVGDYELARILVLPYIGNLSEIFRYL